jgi:hypothetical protein
MCDNIGRKPQLEKSMKSADPKGSLRQMSDHVPPQTDANRRQIREQLNRMLSDRLFQSGSRYGKMLKCVVEHALEGKPDHPKERTIGSEIFGRDPDYDTNSDPIVRVTASELRKRIAQYYVDPQHAAELHIEMPAGSYIPEFRLPTAAPVATRKRLALRFWPLYLLLAALAGGVFLSTKARHTSTAADLFWQPILSSTREVVICIAPPKPNHPPSKAEQVPPITVKDMHGFGISNVSLEHLIAFSKISEYLILHGKRYEIRSAESVSLTDLRGCPAVFVGAFNNDWAMRLLKELRFSFENDEAKRIFSIKDHQNSERRWSVDFSQPYRDLTEDYAIISRVLDPTTEQILVNIAGITKIGTIAAGEFLSNEANLQNLFKQAPQNWQRKNLQFVLATKVINWNCGPSRIVATAFW